MLVIHLAHDQPTCVWFTNILCTQTFLYKQTRYDSSLLRPILQLEREDYSQTHGAVYAQSGVFFSMFHQDPVRNCAWFSLGV